jgi:hypothetical protein
MIKTLSPTTYSPPVPRVSAVSLATEIHRGSALYSLVHRDYKRHLSDAEASITQGHKGRLLSFITGVGKRRCVSPMSESATIRSNIDRRTEGRLSVLIRRKPSNYSQISDLGVANLTPILLSGTQTNCQPLGTEAGWHPMVPLESQPLLPVQR